MVEMALSWGTLSYWVWGSENFDPTANSKDAVIQNVFDEDWKMATESQIEEIFENAMLPFEFKWSAS